LPAKYGNRNYGRSSTPRDGLDHLPARDHLVLIWPGWSPRLVWFRSVVAVQHVGEAVNLCGIVTRIPSTFRDCRETSHDRVEIVGGHLERDADAVVVRLTERAGEPQRRLDVLDGVTDDREQPRCTAEMVEHCLLAPSWSLVPVPQPDSRRLRSGCAPVNRRSPDWTRPWQGTPYHNTPAGSGRWYGQDPTPPAALCPGFVRLVVLRGDLTSTTEPAPTSPLRAQRRPRTRTSTSAAPRRCSSRSWVG
jgi:hypothetical protein